MRVRYVEAEGKSWTAMWPRKRMTARPLHSLLNPVKKLSFAAGSESEALIVAAAIFAPRHTRRRRSPTAAREENQPAGHGSKRGKALPRWW